MMSAPRPSNGEFNIILRICLTVTVAPFHSRDVHVLRCIDANYMTTRSASTSLLLRGQFPELNNVLGRVIDLQRWQKSDGSFRSRQLLVGWDNTPMHRWAQSQFFRSLCFLL